MWEDGLMTTEPIRYDDLTDEQKRGVDEQIVRRENDAAGIPNEPPLARALTPTEIDDLDETRRKGLYLPADVRIELIDRLLVTVDEANKRALSAHGLRFGPCICEYSGPSRIMVGCPTHCPDPGADIEGESA